METDALMSSVRTFVKYYILPSCTVLSGVFQKYSVLRFYFLAVIVFCTYLLVMFRLYITYIKCFKIKSITASMAMLLILLLSTCILINVLFSHANVGQCVRGRCRREIRDHRQPRGICSSLKRLAQEDAAQSRVNSRVLIIQTCLPIQLARSSHHGQNE